MIELKNININFEDNKIFKNLCATIKEGDFITIIGRNGAGKTTLFDLIAGKIKPTAGKIIIDNKDITALDELKRSSFIARLFQNPRFNTVATMTVAENIALSTLKNKNVNLKNLMKNFTHENIEEIFKSLNIKNLLNKIMGSLSGGQRQIIALVMATLSPPKILLLDEPTAALDPQSAIKMLDFTKNYINKHKITTLLITHDQKLAQILGNKLWLLENGTIKELSREQFKNINLINEINYELLETI